MAPQVPFSCFLVPLVDSPILHVGPGYSGRWDRAALSTQTYSYGKASSSRWEFLLVRENFCFRPALRPPPWFRVGVPTPGSSPDYPKCELSNHELAVSQGVVTPEQVIYSDYGRLRADNQK